MVYIIIFLVILVAGAFLFHKLFKSAIKAFLFSFLLFVIMTGIIGFIAYKDITIFKEEFINSEKVVLINTDEGIVAGFRAQELDFEESNPIFLSKEELSDYGTQYEAEGDFSEGVMLIEMENIINDLPEEGLELERMDETGDETGDETVYLTQDEVRNVLYSSTPIVTFTDVITEDNVSDTELSYVESSLREKFETPQQIKTAVAFMCLSKIMEDGGQEQMIMMIKDGSLKLFPDLIILKLFKQMPDSIIKKVAGMVS